jgi:hypothetical protein
MKCQSFPFLAPVFAPAVNWGLSSLHATDETVLDTATIEAITGLNGVSNQTEWTFKVSKPRDDVSVTVEQTHMAPFMGDIHDPKTVRCPGFAQRLRSGDLGG